VTATVRVGSGFDLHAFSDDPARPLVLGGVTIPDGPGLAGHSDADVIAHAIADALLGAVALGDLGSIYGVDDPRLEGADSLGLLADAASRVRDAGWTLVNVDCTVVAERPRLAAHREQMRIRLAEALEIEIGEVSVKVTSADHLGSIGRGEGIACWSIVALQPLA
jgi:2-C-methyl-D-erythritol 2,4-cyclodiphosphate synthase